MLSSSLVPVLVAVFNQNSVIIRYGEGGLLISGHSVKLFMPVIPFEI